MTTGIHIDLSVPKLNVQEQMQATAHNGKCMIGFYNDQNQFVSWWVNMTSMEKLFAIDTFEQMRQKEIKEGR